MAPSPAQPLTRHLSLDELLNRKPDLTVSELRKLREEQEAIASRVSEAFRSGTSLLDEFDSQHRPNRVSRVRSDPFSKVSSFGPVVDPSSKVGLFKLSDSRLETPFVVNKKSPTSSSGKPTLPAPLLDDSDFEHRPKRSLRANSDPSTASKFGGLLPSTSSGGLFSPGFFENSRPSSSLEKLSVVPKKSLTANSGHPASRPFAKKTRSPFLQQALATTAPYISICRPVTRVVAEQAEPCSPATSLKRKADDDDSSEKTEGQAARAPKKRKVVKPPTVKTSDAECKAQLKIDAQRLIEELETEDPVDKPSNYDEFVELFKRSADPTSDTRDPESLLPSVPTVPKAKKRRSKKDKDEESEPPKKRRRRKDKDKDA